MRMRKHAIAVVALVALTLAATAVALGQTTKTVVQNPDGTYSVIEIPTGKEIQVTLDPTAPTTGTGLATIIRDDNGTRLKLHLTGLAPTTSSINLYAVNEAGVVTSLGPIAISNGEGTLATTTALTKFMLIASPETALTTYDLNTPVYFRSTVPEGLAVIPRSQFPTGEKVSASTEGVVAGDAYTVPMLNIPAYKKGDDTKIKVNFGGALTGARANVFITPRKDGPAEVKMRFHELKEAPAGQVFVLWAVSPDNNFVKLGQVVNTGHRNEAEIQAETTLRDFGLLVTMEGASTIGARPVGPRVADIVIVP